MLTKPKTIYLEHVSENQAIIREQVLAGLESAKAGRTKPIDEVLERLERKYLNDSNV